MRMISLSSVVNSPTTLGAKIYSAEPNTAQMQSPIRLVSQKALRTRL